MPASTSAIVCSTLSFIVGAWAFVKCQEVTGPLFEPILEACTNASKGNYESMDDFVTLTGYHAYDTRVGLVVLEVFVCLITQFLHQLTEQAPQGLLTWGSVVVVSFPVGVLMSLEAGRQNVKGPCRWPTLMGILTQLLGISVIFPALWVPSYTYSSSSSESQGVVSSGLAKIVIFLSLPGAILSILVFCLDTDSTLWTTCAGILGGPVLPLIALTILLVPAPKGTVSSKMAQNTAYSSAVSFGLAGIASLVGWLYLVVVAFTNYGWDYTTLLNDIWFEAHPAVAFMTIDTGVLWIGLLLHIGSRSLRGMLEALLGSLVFGPGAACCVALASLEMERAETVAVTKDKKTK